MKAKSVLVVGLGRFGTSIVETLWKSHAEVIAVDNDPAAVDAIKDKTSAAFVGDATMPNVLEGIGAQYVDTAVVTFGEHFEPSVLCAASLVRLGVPEVIARAATERKADILRAVGVKRVIQVETEMGRRVGADITMPLAQDLLDLASHYRVVPWDARGSLVGKTLADAQIRRRYQINVLGVRRHGTGVPGERTRLETPMPEYVIQEGDTLLLVGYGDDVSRFVAEVGD
ncbi:potassium channel family protein [Polyangium spumosum]|uniref:TrkA family potassium uptake protein n=1 Tax=Polyangium spumosum TaxID=889282 RepID=A0A6N7Q3X9_9BACT|nr:TrkA family potassium uptake protein [Polyangium spumosum]MRG97560.1 TrkA family potassium uptake protein [Polyangium spumosum]